MKYGKIHDVYRVNGSVNGNPNYEFVLYEADNPHEALTNGVHDGTGTFVTRRTSSDISDSYGIIPNECKEGKTMSYELTRAGRIRLVKAVA